MSKIIDRCIKASQKNNINSFDVDSYRVNIWLMYLSADMAQTPAMDIESQLKSVGQYRFEDKSNIESMKRISGKFISDLDKSCTEQFACEFGDLADEVRSLLNGYIKNRINQIKI